MNNEFSQLDSDFKNLQIDTAQHTDKYLKVIMQDKMYESLDNLISGINMVLANRYVTNIRQKSELMKKQLVLLSEVYEELVKMQKTWIQMERIFQQGEIKAMLPRESAIFQTLNKWWETEVPKLKKELNKIIVNKIRGQRVLRELRDHNKSLDFINQSLQEMLDAKRQNFPRFYFLSDDEVIDIIATDKTDKLQGMLNKIFDGITRLAVEEQSGNAVAMISKEKEEVKFLKQMKMSGKPDEYMFEIEGQMRIVVGRRLAEGNKSYEPESRHLWVTSGISGQVVATVAQIRWTEETETAINEQQRDVSSLDHHFEQQQKQIIELAKLVSRPDLPSLQRHIIVALITTDVHARDIVEELRDSSVTSTDDFIWKKQLRYYTIDPEKTTPDNTKIEQVQATLMYGHEYMGATSRLVITPLTDRCWITITMALHIQRGANPAGPAGTGKTESTKDLAKAIALFCFVFNCSDQVDYVLVGKLFSGLAQQGCWACLDEFNRINVEVLSVIAQQLLTIRNALIKIKARTQALEVEGGQPVDKKGEQEEDDSANNKFEFEEKMITIKPEFGCHITMNPGYAGRTELPDNLKILFRPVAMMVPSYQLIAEVMLGAEGFQDSKKLSQKMTQLYKLSSEQLSQQSHYDFGMRAVKSVLVMAGSLKRKFLDQNEEDVLIRAMKEANIPKFLKDDVPLFTAIV